MFALVPYGAQLVFRYPLLKASSTDAATNSDYTPASGDVTCAKDGGAYSNIGTLPTYEDKGVWEFTASATELQCAELVIAIRDVATKVIQDDTLVFRTYGHASAWMVGYPSNVTYWNGTAIPGVDTNGYPKVTIKAGTGTGEVSLNSGAVTVGTNSDKTGYALTSGERASIAAAVEGALLDDNDGQALLAGIASAVQSLFDAGTDVPVATLVTAIRDAILDRVLSGNHDTSGTVGKLIQDAYAKANSAEGIVASGTHGNAALKTLIDDKPSAAQNADAVWDEAMSGHSTAGTYGEWATNMATRISTAFATLVTNLTAMITGSGGSAKFTTTALSNAPAGGGGSGEVTSFTAAAIAQLQGVTVSGSVPAITSFGFSDPIPRQSSWPSTRPLSIVVTGWTGPDLADATSITLTGVSRIGGRKHTLSWSITPADVTNSGTTYTLPLVLTSTQTSVAAGEWSIQVVAVIDSKNYFVVNPNGKMTVIELGA